MNKSTQIWVEQMRLRVPELMAAGMTLEQAVAKAHHDFQAVLLEILDGKTVRAKKARDIIAAHTWEVANRNRIAADAKRMALAEPA